jgi:hypothetical protein
LLVINFILYYFVDQVAPAANAGKKGKGKGTPNKAGADGGGGGKKFEPVPFINVRTLS